MKLPQRTKILVEGDHKLLPGFAGQIRKNYVVHTERGAKKSLAMTKARDSVSFQPFYIGEVLMTECTVSIHDIFGFGAIMGEDYDRAYELAIVDAAFRAGLPETKDWIPLLEKEEKRIEIKHQEELALVLRTKVDFGDLEGPNDKRE